MQMNLSEMLADLKNNGLSDLDIANKCGISQPTITRLRNQKGKIKKIHPSTLKALADAFGYDLKYEHGEPQFFKKTETAPTRGDPVGVDEALKIKEYLGDLGIGSLDELKQCFYDAGVVFGRKESEIAEMFRSLRAIDGIRNLAKKEVK
jgi:transcriptional regulator with XRE-family HTH domain